MTDKPRHPNSRHPYRKIKIPKNKKPMRNDLIKKHKQYTNRNISFSYHKGDLMDKILTNLKKQIGGSKCNILRNALFSYNLFIQQSLKK